MRILFVLLLILTYSWDIYAQTDYVLSGTVIKSSVSSLEKYGALLLDDSCAFHVQDKFGKNVVPDVCKWSFGVEAEQGNYVAIKNATSIDYGIIIDSSAYEYSGPKYKRYDVKNDSSVYYQGKVSFEGEYQGRKIQLDKYFYINILPSVPKIKVLDITWSDYDDQWNIYEDGYMTIQINACRTEHIYIVEQDASFTGHMLASYFKPNVDAEKGVGLLEFYDGDRCFRFWAVNYSGMVECKDTLYTSKVATSIPIIKTKGMKPFYPNPVKDILYVQEGMDAIFPVSIYDSRGRLVKYVGIPMSDIDVSKLVEGVYFILYKDRFSGRKLTFKMIKNR